jgi:membrane fusion protein
MDSLPEEATQLDPLAGRGQDEQQKAETEPGPGCPAGRVSIVGRRDGTKSEPRLFRTESVAAQEQPPLGEILLARPVTFSFLTAFAVVVATTLVLFLVFGEYTRKEHVTGQVALDRGLAKLYSPVAGTVVSRQVKEGDKVRKGEGLLVISAERTSSTKGDAQAAIVKQLESRHSNLQGEWTKQDTISRADEAALRQKVRDSKAEAVQLEHEISTRKERLVLNKENLERYGALAKENIISVSELHDHQQEYLDQRVDLETQLRSLISLRKDIASMENDLRTAPLKAANALSAIERDMADIEQQTVDNEAHREIVVPAQGDGIVTAVLVEPGQIVTLTTPLLGVLPVGSKFEARLYVPSTAIGFMKVGTRCCCAIRRFLSKVRAVRRQDRRDRAHGVVAGRTAIDQYHHAGDAVSRHGRARFSNGDGLRRADLPAGRDALGGRRDGRYAKAIRMGVGAALHPFREVLTSSS